MQASEEMSRLLARRQLLLSKGALRVVRKAHRENTVSSTGEVSTAVADRTKKLHRAKKLARRESLSRKKAEEDVVTRSGIIYLGHIPHGFYEQEMRRYFSQFGRVKSVRLSRSRRTGRSRGYAFVKFECAEVSEVAAETMNNYLMYGRLLKCHTVSGHRRMFKRGRVWRSQWEREEAMRQRYNKLQRVSSEQDYRKRIKNVARRYNRRQRKIEKRGYQFDCNSSLSQLMNINRAIRSSHKKFYNPESDRSDSENEYK